MRSTRVRSRDSDEIRSSAMAVATRVGDVGRNRGWDRRAEDERQERGL